jgi:hypothetical protein
VHRAPLLPLSHYTVANDEASHRTSLGKGRADSATRSGRRSPISTTDDR